MNMNRKDKLKAEHKSTITEDCYIAGKILRLSGTNCNVLLYTGACKSFISISFYMKCPSIKTYQSFLLKHGKYG